MNILLPQILQRLDIVVNVQIAVALAGLDIIVDIDTLNSGDLQTGRRDLIF